MSVISYWQDCLRLAGDVGVCGEAASLPQDEATAAVVIAAVLARNYAPGQWPGWYRARVEWPGGVVTVAEDDARVRLARVLLERRDWADFTASALAVARANLLAMTLGQGPDPAVCSSQPGAVTGLAEGVGA